MTNEPLIPHVPKIFKLYRISQEEAALIQELRKITFGEITIHKYNGDITRLQSQKSILIRDIEVVL
jgi:hypothetical protein